MMTDSKHSSTRQDHRFWFGVLLPTAAVHLAAVVVSMGWASSLPASVALKWDLSTHEVISVAPLWLGIVSLAVPSASILFLMAVMKRFGKLAGWGRRGTIGALSGVAVFTATALPVMLSGQVGLADARLAPDPGAMLGATALFSIAFAVIAGAVAGKRQSETTRVDAAPTPALDLAPGEVAVWTTSTTAWVCLLGGGMAGLVLGVLGIITTIWWLTAVGVILVALGLVTGRWTITVDHRGLTASTFLGLSSFTVPATAEATAEVVTVRALSDFLGWGIRANGSSIGLIFRNGQALRVHRPSGDNLTVTTNDATTAAALFNAQVARNQTSELTG